ADIRQTRFYQEVFQEGQQLLILQLLNRIVGPISAELQTQVEALTLNQLAALGEALLDFETVADLEHWLQAKTTNV
ncbi:MAG: DUF4351 domain-containing protein, partial [Cyanobacteria bacterium P01_H01_bin.121]